MSQVLLLYARGCPNWRALDGLLRQMAVAWGFTLDRREVVTLEEAQRLGFAGSPTVLINGRDPFPSDGNASLSCRLYATETGLRGVPATEGLLAALHRAALDG